MPEELQPRPLCDLCNNILADCSYDWWVEWYRNNPVALGNVSWSTYSRQHHTSYKSFSRGIAKNCWICRYLANPRLEEEGFVPLQYRLVQNSEARTTGPRRPVYTLSDQHDLYYQTFQIEEIQPWTSLHSLAQASKMTAWTGSEAVPALTRAWLAQCQQQHHSCSSNSDKDWHRTRLPVVSEDLIHLRISSETEPHGRYATLSHCWGTKKFWVLTIETMQQLMDGVSLA